MDVRLRPRSLVPVYLAVLLHAGCGGESATAPTTLTPSPEGSAGRAITGTVTDAVQALGRAGVTVAIDRAGTASTVAGGQFVMESGAPNGSYRTTLTGPDIVTRQTTIALRSNPLSFSVIPSSFDITSFDEFARSLAGGVLIRWSTRPSLIVESALVSSPGNQNVALEERIPSSEVDRVITRLSQALPLLTGSTFSAFASVNRQNTPAGQEIRMYTPGAITVVYYTESNGACGQAGPIVTLPSYEIRSAGVWLRYGCASFPTNTTTMVHELGHALGYGHVTGATSVMRPSGGVDITAFDRSAATVVFRRPAGNRAPDTDPDDFRISSGSTLTTSGVLIIPPVP